MMDMATFRYVLRVEGWYFALRWAWKWWVIMPWRNVRIRVAEIILSLLRVSGYF